MRRICVVTGTRAEYGLLQPLLSELRGDPAIRLQLVATAMHLAPEFGLTVRQIEADGFDVDERVEMLLSSDTPVGITKSMGLGTIGFADAFARLRPDLLVLLGDRFEILAAAQAALVARIPIAHLHGGEATEGLIDEAIRHAITKMAHLHFTATAAYRQRVIQLGEEPDRVFNVGATAIDNVRQLERIGRPVLEADLGFGFGDPTFVVTFHPVTLERDTASTQVNALTEALDRFPQAKVLITLANADPEGRAVNRLLEHYRDCNPERVGLYAALGRHRYLSAVSLADVVIGNSSSGLIEVPALGKAVVNIGERQRGRIRPPGVIDCPPEVEAIAGAITSALTPEHRELARRAEHPYGDGHAAERIAAILRDHPLEGLLLKGFHDLGATP